MKIGELEMIDDFDNQTLIQKTKDIHGELYHRINSLQVQVNRLVEENRRLIIRNNDLQKRTFTQEEMNQMRKTFEHALEYLK